MTTLFLIEFLNTWFFLMREPYTSSDKLEPRELQNASSRTGHQAYLVCYEDSQTTQNIVVTDNTRIRNQSHHSLHAWKKPGVGQTPLYFTQVTMKSKWWLLTQHFKNFALKSCHFLLRFYSGTKWTLRNDVSCQFSDQPTSKLSRAHYERTTSKNNGSSDEQGT